MKTLIRGGRLIDPASQTDRLADVAIAGGRIVRIAEPGAAWPNTASESASDSAPERVLDEALAMARQIAAKSSATVAIGKEAFYRQIEQPLAEAYGYAADVMVRNMMTEDAREGIGAFVAKRKPVWKGC